MDNRTIKLAETLVRYCVEVKPGDWVWVRGSTLAEPLVEEVTRLVLEAGGNPTVTLGFDTHEEIIIRSASESQLTWISPIETTLWDQIDALISIRAAKNTRSMSGIEPSKQRLRSQARRSLTETYMRRSAEGSLRWVGTQYPCQAFAQEAEMHLTDYEDFVYRATFSDQPNPVAKWQEMHATQQTLVDWLTGKEQMAIRGPHVDLVLSIKDRIFINSDGKNNMPSGEIFTGPVETSVNGWVYFNYPAIREGREVEGVKLEFKDGKVISASAAKNEAYLISQLDADEGSRFLGEFAIGTNYGIDRFTKSILFDEKIGGTMHMAVGAGYPQTGSQNKSSIHWDFICDMRNESEIRVDGELFYQNGQFVIGQ